MLNQMMLQGRLTKQPELKTTQTGINYVLFTVAWSEKYKEVERKLFMMCRAWRGTADFIAGYFGKGQEILVEGRVETETWNDNHQVDVLQVVRAHFCGPKVAKVETESAPEPPSDFVNVPDSDLDELPFH